MPRESKPTPNGEVPSPCLKICLLDNSDVCKGCHRTLDEIARWTQMTTEEKLAVWKRIGKDPKASS